MPAESRYSRVSLLGAADPEDSRRAAEGAYRYRIFHIRLSLQVVVCKYQQISPFRSSRRMIGQPSRDQVTVVKNNSGALMPVGSHIR